MLAEADRFVSSRGSTLSAGFVSGDYFAGLRAPILLGRGLTAYDANIESGGVAVLPLATNELGARDDDRRPRAAQDVARMILRAVTTNVVPAGRSTRLPFTRTATLSGSASASCSERPSNVFRWPRSSVPL